MWQISKGKDPAIAALKRERTPDTRIVLAHRMPKDFFRTAPPLAVFTTTILLAQGDSHVRVDQVFVAFLGAPGVRLRQHTPPLCLILFFFFSTSWPTRSGRKAATRELIRDAVQA